MSHDSTAPKIPAWIDVKGIFFSSIFALGGCLFTMYTTQVRVGDTLKVFSQAQKETISVVKAHETKLNEGDTWKRVMDIRLTVIEQKLGIRSLDK